MKKPVKPSALNTEDTAIHLEPSWMGAINDATDTNACPKALSDAVEYIESVYSSRKEASNGYTSLAWCCRNVEADPAALCKLVRKDIDAERLTGEYILLASLLALRANDTDEAIQLTIKEIPGLCSHDTIIAKTALDYLDQQIKHDHANGIITFEAPIGLNSSTWLISLAQAYAEREHAFEKVPPLIENVYRLTPTRNDAFARCAWIHFHSGKQLDQLIHWMEKDNQAGRLSPKWKINLARAYSESGQIDKSWPLIEEAYHADETLQDGYAACAWKHFHPQQKFGKLIRWMEKDNKAGRLSPKWKVNLARAYAESGQIDKSWPLIEEAYRADETLQDGYATCAWKHFHPQQKFEKLIHWMEKDNTANRLSPSWMINLARLYADKGEFQKAWLLIENAYHTDQTLQDGHACIAQSAVKCGKISYALKLFNTDYQNDRISPNRMLQWARLLLYCGYRDKATTLAEKACSADAELGPEWKSHLKENKKAPLPDIEWHIDQIFDNAQAPCRNFVNYTRSHNNILRILQDYQAITKLVSKESRIIDIGCTPPFLISLLSHSGFNNLTAVDPASGTFRTFFESRGIQWIQQSTEKLHLSELDNTADIVCMCEVLEHLTGNLIPPIGNICSIVKPGGLLFITTPNLRSISGLFSLIAKHSGLATKPDESVRMQYEREYGDMGYFGHLREYTTKEVIDLFKSFGMIHKETITTPPFRRDRVRDKIIYWIERAIPSLRVNQQLVFYKALNNNNRAGGLCDRSQPTD